MGSNKPIFIAVGRIYNIIIDNSLDARYDFEGYKVEIDIILFGGL